MLSNEWIKIFAAIGVMAIAVGFALISWAFSEWLRDRIVDLKRTHKMKHRFDGKPIAKCWCRDCRTHNNKTGVCSLPGISRYTPDNGFCYEADPVWKEKENGRV